VQGGVAKLHRDNQLNKVNNQVYNNEKARLDRKEIFSRVISSVKVREIKLKINYILTLIVRVENGNFQPGKKIIWKISKANVHLFPKNFQLFQYIYIFILFHLIIYICNIIFVNIYI